MAFKHLEGNILRVYLLFGVLLTAVLFQSHNEDPEKDKTPQNCRERDLEDVAQKLEMAHGEIRRLTDELQGKEKVQSKLGKLC